MDVSHPIVPRDQLGDLGRIGEAIAQCHWVFDRKQDYPIWRYVMNPASFSTS
jgi:hypothetical protein